jgi:hypothetical protein
MTLLVATSSRVAHRRTTTVQALFHVATILGHRREQDRLKLFAVDSIGLTKVMAVECMGEKEG